MTENSSTKTIKLDLTDKSYPVLEVREKYIPLVQEVLSEANEFKVNKTIIKTYRDIFNLCRDIALSSIKDCVKSLDEQEIEANIWAFEKLYKQGFTINQYFRGSLKTDKNLAKAYELFKLDQKKKRMESNSPRIIIEYLNKPSEQALDNFNRVVYEILVNKMEEEYGHR